jgi:hypothetical protein
MWHQHWRQLQRWVWQLELWGHWKWVGLLLGHWSPQGAPSISLCAGALMATDERAATIGDGAIDFCEGHRAPGIAHGDNGEKGVGR